MGVSKRSTEVRTVFLEFEWWYFRGLDVYVYREAAAGATDEARLANQPEST